MPAAPHTHTAGVTTEVSPDIATCPLEGKTPTDQGHVFKALPISASLSSGSFSVLPFVHPFLQTSFLYESKEASPGSLLSREASCSSATSCHQSQGRIRMGPAEVTWSSLNQSLSRSGPGHLPIRGLERRCVRGVWGQAHWCQRKWRKGSFSEEN